MLRVLLLLDCNQCGFTMGYAPVDSLLDARDWQSAGYTLMDELKELATSTGWDFHNNRMCCGACRSDQQEN